MFHLAAYTASIDAPALAQIPVLADQSLTVSGSSLVVPEEVPLVVRAAGIGVNLTRMQLQSPSLRRVFLVELNPLNRSAAAPTLFQAANMSGDGVILQPDELIDVFASEDAAGASRITALIWLADAPFSDMTGQEIFTVRVTSTTAVVANAWSNVPLVFDQTLPAGRYQLVGAQMRSANMLAFRFLFRGASWRPGGLGQVNVGDFTFPSQRYGAMGVWGEFRHNLPPTMDVLANGADAAFAGELDLIYLG